MTNHAYWLLPVGAPVACQNLWHPSAQVVCAHCYLPARYAWCPFLPVCLIAAVSVRVRSPEPQIRRHEVSLDKRPSVTQAASCAARETQGIFITWPTAAGLETADAVGQMFLNGITGAFRSAGFLGGTVIPMEPTGAALSSAGSGLPSAAAGLGKHAFNGWCPTLLHS